MVVIKEPKKKFIGLLLTLGLMTPTLCMAMQNKPGEKTYGNRDVATVTNVASNALTKFYLIDKLGLSYNGSYTSKLSYAVLPSALAYLTWEGTTLIRNKYYPEKKDIDQKKRKKEEKLVRKSMLANIVQSSLSRIAAAVLVKRLLGSLETRNDGSWFSLRSLGLLSIRIAIEELTSFTIGMVWNWCTTKKKSTNKQPFISTHSKNNSG